MCGPPRPSSGGRIAVLFPSSPSSSPTQSPSINSYSILFHNHNNPDAKATKATFRVDNTDIDNLEMLRGSSCIDLRIEYVPSFHFTSVLHSINRSIWIVSRLLTGIENTATSHPPQHSPLRPFTPSVCGHGRVLRPIRRWSVSCRRGWIWGFLIGGLWGGRLRLLRMGGWEWGLLGLIRVILFGLVW